MSSVTSNGSPLDFKKPSRKRALVLDDTSFQTTAKRRRSSIYADSMPNDDDDNKDDDDDNHDTDNEISCNPSSSTTSHNHDRFLPSLKTRIPLFAPVRTNSPRLRFAAEVLGLMPSKTLSYHDNSRLSLPQAPPDPTFPARVHYTQILHSKKPSHLSSYSAARNAGSSSYRVLDTGLMNEYTLHPCAWSSQNVLAAVLRGNVLTHNHENNMVRTIENHGLSRSVEWISDKLVAIGGNFGSVHLINVETIYWRRVWNTPTTAVQDRAYHLGLDDLSIDALHFSKERNVLATGRRTGCITYYDTRMPDCIRHEDKTPVDSVFNIRWSPDGMYLAIGQKSGTVNCVDFRTFKSISLALPNQSRKNSHRGPVKSLAWAPWTPHLLASGNLKKDSTVHIWSLSGSDTSTHNYKYLRSAKFASDITSLHFSPHTMELLSTHGSPTLDIPKKVPNARRRGRSAPNQQPLPIFQAIAVHLYPSLQLAHIVRRAHSAEIVDSVLSHDGTSITTCGKDETLRSWKIWGERKKEEKSPTMMDGFKVR